ncbi:MAG: efflux RND transporter permease subunit, partial [Pseudomonadota bacterium]
MSLISTAMNRSRTMIMVLGFVAIAGALAFINIPKEANPDVTVPIMYVTLHLDGISPKDSETLLVRPVEKELRGIEAIKEMRAAAYEHGGFVLLEFEAGFDPDVAIEEVRARVDAAKVELPDEADEPQVHEVNLNLFPVISVGLYGNIPVRELSRIAETLSDDLESLPEILEAKVAGKRENVTDIIIKPSVLEAYDIDIQQVLQVFRDANQLIATGSIERGDGAIAVKVPGLVERSTDILDLPIKVSGDSVVRVRDVTEIRQTFKTPTTVARLNGEPALSIQISKRTGQNIISAIENVRRVVGEHAQNWPEGLDHIFYQDESENIRSMLSDLQNNIISAVLLVMIVVMIVLGFRGSMLVGIAIPGSFLSALLILSQLGLTVNIVVLFSLILSVGMLVDGAIVVSEYADRQMRLGVSAKTAYWRAASRMAAPISASTATTLAAFLPLMFWPGIVGQFMKYLPLTLIVTLCVSLAMALLFLPVLGVAFNNLRRMLKHLALFRFVKMRLPPEVAKDAEPDAKAIDLQLPSTGMSGIYVMIMRIVLKAPIIVVIVTIATLFGIFNFYGKNNNGVIFFPNVEPEQFIIHVLGRGNLSIFEMSDMVSQVEEKVLAYQAKTNAFHNIAVTVDSEGQGDETPADTIGSLALELNDWDKRPSAEEIVAALRQISADIPGVRAEFRVEKAGPPAGKPIYIVITSQDPALMEGVVENISDQMRTDSRLVDIEDSRPPPELELRLEIDRAQASKYNISTGLIGDLIKLATQGFKVTDYRPVYTDDEVDIIVRYPQEYRSLSQLQDLRVNTRDGAVPIGTFVDQAMQRKSGTLERIDQKRIHFIKAEVARGVLVDDMIGALQANIDALDLPRGVQIYFKGENEDQKESEAFLVKALMVALFLIAIILLTQF